MASKTMIKWANLVGKGYKKFWNCKKRYRILKGGRGSKKSCTTSIWFIFMIMFFWGAFKLKPHALVIRRYYNTHRNSTYAQLKWAINKIGCQHLWDCKISPLELTYKPSGQKIMFRGLDNPDSITSITVDDGYLCWTWWEEFFQCADEEAFNKVDLSIRGEIPAPLFKQHTGTMNPWSENTWIKARFFDNPDENTEAFTTNYLCNEFLGEDDLKIFEDMKVRNPRRYNIEGLGNWGIAEGLIFNNVEEREFDWGSMIDAKDNYGKRLYKNVNGMDFGYTNDPTAFVAMMVDEKNRIIYIYDEFYETYMTNEQIYQKTKLKGFEKARICADSEDPRTINELLIKGLSGIFGAKKGQGSVLFGIQKLQEFKFVIHPRCQHTKIEFMNFVWDKDKETGKPINKPIEEFDHAISAIRYACEEINLDTFSF